MGNNKERAIFFSDDVFPNLMILGLELFFQYFDDPDAATIFKSLTA
jgi:hypothetical protein